MFNFFLLLLWTLLKSLILYLKPPKACSGLSVGTFHTTAWLSGSGSRSRALAYETISAMKMSWLLGQCSRNLSQLPNKHIKLCFLYILHPHSQHSSIILVHIFMFFFVLLNNCVVTIPPSPTLVLQCSQGWILFPNSHVFANITNANKWETQWNIHFSSYSDIVETCIDLFLSSPILSLYLDGEKDKATFSNNIIFFSCFLDFFCHVDVLLRKIEWLILSVLVPRATQGLMLLLMTIPVPVMSQR